MGLVIILSRLMKRFGSDAVPGGRVVVGKRPPSLP